MGLAEMFSRSVHRFNKKTALVLGERHVSYEELNRLSDHFVAFLYAQNISAGDQVLFLARNSIEYVAALLGCFKLRCIPCPTNWCLSPRELSALFQQQKASAFICDRITEPLLKEALDLLDSQHSYITFETIDWFSEAPVPTFSTANGSDIALQFFTSGSTGLPKAISHTHNSLCSYIYSYTTESEWTSSDIYQTSANLFHLSGFSIIIALMIGSTAVIFDCFSLSNFLCTLKRERSTRVSLGLV